LFVELTIPEVVKVGEEGDLGPDIARTAMSVILATVLRQYFDFTQNGRQPSLS
jgi:hypothetical protein